MMLVMVNTICKDGEHHPYNHIVCDDFIISNDFIHELWESDQHLVNLRVNISGNTDVISEITDPTLMLISEVH